MRQPATSDGRKRRKRKQKTKQTIARIDACGLTALDHMLAVMRNSKARAAVRLEAARQAAPYVHPQLAPIDIEATRLIGRLLAEIVKFDANPAQR
jgi:hypothetical protein